MKTTWRKVSALYKRERTAPRGKHIDQRDTTPTLFSTSEYLGSK